MPVETYQERSIIPNKEVEEMSIVRSETFIDYLLPTGDLADRESEFSPHLVLDSFSPSLEELNVLAQTQNSGSAYRELGRTYYYDRLDQAVHYTPIIQGRRDPITGHPTVSSGVRMLMEENKIPLLPVHSEPEDGLLSDLDYLLMLQKGYAQRSTDEYIPTVKGLLKLGPTEQRLVLVTTDTPKPMPELELLQFIDDWKHRYEDQDSEIRNTLFEQVNRIRDENSTDYTLRSEYQKAREEFMHYEKIATEKVNKQVADFMKVAQYRSTDLTNFFKVDL